LQQQLHACREEREGSWKGGRRSWETEGRRGEEEQLGDRREERSGEERRAAMGVAAVAGREERRGMNVLC